MLNTLLRANDYTNEEIWKKERKLLNENWVFAGFKRDLLNHNDFIVNSFNGVSYFVQNMHGELVAFRNVCPHRFAALKPEGKGNGPLVCPYHLWGFKKCGGVKGIPKKSEFNLLEKEEKEISLERWHVDECGEFIFVSKGEPDVSLGEFLGDVEEVLITFSDIMGEKVDENKLVINCNWKIAVENTLESYHVSKIHSETFAKLGSSGNEFSFFGPHSKWETKLASDITKKAKKVRKLLNVEGDLVDGYRHYLVFPNITIACSFGTSFAVQEFVSLGPGVTKFVSHVFLPKTNSSSNVAVEMTRSFSNDMTKFNRQVFDEDKVICEEVQKGCETGWEQYGLVGEMEKRVFEFQKNYRKKIDVI